MKKTTLLLIILSIIVVSPCFSLSKEELSNLFYSADTPLSLEKATQIGLHNIPLLEEILLIPSGEYIARFRSFALLRRASQSGLLPKAKFFDIAFYQLKHLKHLSSQRFFNEEKIAFSQMLVYYSYSPTNSVSVDDNFANFDSILEAMLSNGLINNYGIRNSLAQKVENAQKAFVKGNPKTAVKILNATINEINALLGKQIDEQGATVLVGYIKNLIDHVATQ
jgi:hypothetical protein